MRMAEQNEPAKDLPVAPRRGKFSEQDWNIKELLHRLDEDQEFLCDLLRIFRDDSQANLQKARAALADGDLPGLMRHAHTLKGMLRNLSMNRAGEEAFALESASRQGKGKEAEEILAHLEQAVAELLPEVDAQLAEVKT
jgi:HPt (histidine-containing phosphotransfer) domain-containing protein